MRYFKDILWIMMLLCISVSHLNSQSVGLVLSGGGAKGLAHIGVIKALEENNIPIDYVAGTSMGAIIGGLYAMGYSPDEMIEIFKSNRFKVWLEGKIPEEYTFFFKKKDANASWLDLNIGNDSVIKPLIPTNIIPSFQMDFAFVEEFSAASAAANYDFNQLMIPFRCVAADIYSSGEVILSKGDLAESIRASMSIPFVFKPITINGRLLFDGGMYNNFPTDVMIRDFDPEYIIGVKVSSNSDRPKDDDLMLQLENMLTVKTNFDIPRRKGILVEPVVQNVGILDFDQIDKLVRNGYIAGLSKLNSIQSRVTRRVDGEYIRDKRKRFRSKWPNLLFQNIEIEGLNQNQTRFIQKSIRQNKRIFSFNQFKTECFKLLSDDNVYSLYPRARFNDTTGYFDILLEAKKAKAFKAEVGGNLSSNVTNQAFVGAEYKLFDSYSGAISANTHFGRFYSSLHLDSRLYFPIFLPVYLEAGLTLNNWDFVSSNLDFFFDDVRPSFLKQGEYNAYFNAGFPIKTNAKIVLGASFASNVDKYYQIPNFLKSDTADKSSLIASNYSIAFEKNNLNYKQYANMGSRTYFSARYLKGDERYVPGSTSDYESIFEKSMEWYEFDFQHEQYYLSGPKYRYGFLVNAHISNKPFLQNYTASIISAHAFQPVVESKSMFLEKYRANNYFAIGLRNVFNIISKVDLRAEVYAFQPLRQIIRLEDQSATYGPVLASRSYLASLALVYQSPVGPASISLNWYDKVDKKFYFSFNFGYLLFNKKGIER